MKYCAACRSEYRDEVGVCSDCGGAEFIRSDETRPRESAPPHELDTRNFVRAASAEDPLTSEQFAAVLRAANIPAIARARRGGTVDSITSGSMPWWEILVPEEFLSKASALLKEEQSRMDAAADENARAAEEEEASSET